MIFAMVLAGTGWMPVFILFILFFIYFIFFIFHFVVFASSHWSGGGLGFHLFYFYALRVKWPPTMPNSLINPSENSDFCSKRGPWRVLDQIRVWRPLDASIYFIFLFILFFYLFYFPFYGFPLVLAGTQSAPVFILFILFILFFYFPFYGFYWFWLAPAGRKYLFYFFWFILFFSFILFSEKWRYMGARLPRLEYFIYFPSRVPLWLTPSA